jgi:hypothetical protein
MEMKMIRRVLLLFSKIKKRLHLVGLKSRMQLGHVKKAGGTTAHFNHKRGCEGEEVFPQISSIFFIF